MEGEGFKENHSLTVNKPIQEPLLLVIYTFDQTHCLPPLKKNTEVFSYQYLLFNSSLPFRLPRPFFFRLLGYDILRILVDTLEWEVSSIIEYVLTTTPWTIPYLPSLTGNKSLVTLLFIFIMSLCLLVLGPFSYPHHLESLRVFNTVLQICENVVSQSFSPRSRLNVKKGRSI